MHPMTLSDFIEGYVKLRHPHHYDPSSWPAGLWIAFAWTLMPALLLLHNDARRIVVFITLLLSIALIAAGVWFTSETLVQMSLYRFSIYVQLLGCVAAACWVKAPRLIGIAGSIAIVAICMVRGPLFGAFEPIRDDAEYVELCEWVSQNTSLNDVFLVPPNEESMRLVGQRAIVVNFKAVPQLSGELLEWRRRMCTVLDLPGLNGMPHQYRQTLADIGTRYEQLSDEQLVTVARKFDARYLVVAHPLQTRDLAPVFFSASRKWFLYDLGRGG
jgi:hypothetical protein